MDFYRSVLKPLAFRLDAEFVHEAALSLIAGGFFRPRPFEHPILKQMLFGVGFPNPIGLAAGFDKNGVAAERWEDLGFGFAELGTATYHPQPGNPKPRLFRLPADDALINRMGFNNDGARALSQRLKAAGPTIPLGVNLGKSKISEFKDAPKDYQAGFRLLHHWGDYFVVNVSSPNTPGLRTLQEKGPLLEILAALREVDSVRPLFVKVAPDLEPAALDDVAEVALRARLTGLVATNTSTGRAGLSRDPGVSGGLSGRPIKDLSNRTLSHLSKACGKEMILIGVGGIFDAEDLFEKIALGAHLCQIYTGWIYGGPNLIPHLLRGLVALMDSRGYASLGDLRGSANL